MVYHNSSSLQQVITLTFAVLSSESLVPPKKPFLVNLSVPNGMNFIRFMVDAYTIKIFPFGTV